MFCHNPSLYHRHGDENCMISDLADGYPGKSLKSSSVHRFPIFHHLDSSVKTHFMSFLQGKLKCNTLDVVQ